MAPMSPENIAGKRHPYLPTDLEDGGQQQKVALSQLHDPGAKGCNPHTPGVVDNRTPENHVAAAINDVGSVEGGTASRLKDPRSGGLSLPVLLQQKGERCDADKASASAAGAAISIAPFRLSGPGPMQQQQHLNNTSVDTIVAAAHASATSTPKLQTPRPSAPLSPCQGSWRSICSIDVATAAAAAAPGARTTDTSESTSTHVKVSSRPVLPFKASDSLPGAVSAAWSILGDEHSTRSPISTGGLLPAEQRSLASGPYQQRPPPHRVQSTLNDESRLFKRMDSSFQLSTLTTMNPSGLLLTTMMDSSTLALCDTAVFECCPHAPSDEATRVHAGPPAPNPCIISATDNIANSTVDLLGYQLSCKATPALSLGTCSDETILSSAKGQRDAEGQEQYDSMLDSLISTTLRHMPCSPTSPTSHCTSVEQPAPNMETRASIEFSAPVGATALSSNRCAKLATENIAATAASSDMLADRGFLVVPTTMISEGRDNPLAAVNPDAVVARIQPIRSLDRQQRSGIQGSSSPVAHHRHLTTKQGGTRQSGRQNYNTRLMMSADLHTEVVPKRLQQPAGRYLLRSQTAITHSAETSRPVEPGNSSGHIPYAWEEPVSALSSAANGRQEPAVISESRAADFIRQQKVPQRNLATAADPTDCFLSNEGAVSSRSRSRMLSNGRIAPTNNALIGAATAMPILPTANPAGSRSRLSIMMSSVSLSRVGLETSVDATPGSPIQTIKITRDAGTCEEVATAAARLLPPLANPPCRSARTTRMQQLPEQQAPPEVALKYAVSGMLDRDVHSENGKELGSHVSTRLRQNGKPQLAARYSIGSMATAGLVDGADVTKKNTLLRKWFKTVKGVFSTTKK
ncbi:hypothetical protein Vretifemale_20224 [Volvox reticuliferus]|uniref:Uncharacterized protein n=2 Tax=Volvox reticuliferus TaxID=1737510 RepID=A0A8J4G1F7_9CHLO|nr:hypothetical protein Vretifemale_20224 [Volvox reticuliferus]